MKENAYQSIIQGKIYISVQKNYKHPRQLKINKYPPKKKLHVRIMLNYTVKS